MWFIFLRVLLEGRYDGRVSDDCYVDVTTHNDQLYAVLYGSKAKAKLHVFHEPTDDRWEVARLMTLPCDGYTTIQVTQ